ncbi:MAG TPA: sigma-70 family RNA polymerase sigma factor [Pyrinomonadaceae bacterium]|jgi:RNA polymerase sigma-70 factor (ECF subfamily)
MSESEMTGNLLFFASGEATAADAAARSSAKSKAEARLVERACGGDREAFGELYRLFAPLVHGIVLARVPRDEVDDIAQNVFLSAYKNLHALRDYNAIGAWLAMIARNYSNEFYRREKPTEELSEDLAQTDAPQTEAREILSAIRSLPDAYKETLILRLVEGMTGPEIAEQTGLTPESVRVNLHRGMKLLRQKLGIKE